MLIFNPERPSASLEGIDEESRLGDRGARQIHNCGFGLVTTIIATSPTGDRQR